MEMFLIVCVNETTLTYSKGDHLKKKIIFEASSDTYFFFLTTLGS